MGQIRKHVKVFLASPNDLAAERRAAKNVCDEFNDLFAEEFGYQVELVGWEDTISGSGRPQTIINRELDQCELFIGILHQRWGTPPSKNSKFSSGFEEEFRTSLRKLRKSGKPALSMYFKEIPPDRLPDPGDQLKKVLDFKQELIDGKEILFEEFPDTRDFERRIWRCLTDFVRKTRAAENLETSKEQQTPLQASASTNDPRTSQTTHGLISPESALFLKEFLEDARNAKPNEALQPIKIARLRLLASATATSENDKNALGVHDANLIFAELREIALGPTENVSLIEAGLEHYREQVVPLWNWVKAMAPMTDSYLSVYSLTGTQRNREHALDAMRLVATPIDDSLLYDRKGFISLWLGELSTTDVKNAALRYLGEHGIREDLPLIRAEYQRNSSDTANSAATAMVRISLRDSSAEAFALLCELNPSQVSVDLLDELFSASLDPVVLAKGLDRASSMLRKRSAMALFSRSLLAQADAEALMKDADAETRFIALMTLVKSGKRFDYDAAKTILVRKSSGGLLSAFSSNRDEGSEWLDEYERRRIAALSSEQLVAMAKIDGFLTRDAENALARRNFSKYAASIRSQIDDRYAALFERELAEYASRNPGKLEIVARLRGSAEQIRKHLTAEGLDVICDAANKADLTRVRDLVGSGFVGYRSAATEYLGKLGEWSDIQLILDSLKHPKELKRSTLFSDEDDDPFASALLIGRSRSDRYSLAARAIVALGRKRFDELVAIQMPSGLRQKILSLVPAANFKRASDKSVMKLLTDADDGIRKASVQLLVATSGKARLQKLLDDYMKRDGRYYNVIHWLDFGISVPQALAQPCIRRALARAQK